MDNLLVRATERTVYGFIDPRAVFATQQSEFWHLIWMASSCCCGVSGPSQRVDDRLPNPDPLPLGW